PVEEKGAGHASPDPGEPPAARLHRVEGHESERVVQEVGGHEGEQDQTGRQPELTHPGSSGARRGPHETHYAEPRTARPPGERPRAAQDARYRPRNTGGRFSANARTPSAKSSVCPLWAMAWLSCSIWVSRLSVVERWKSRLPRPRASVGPWASSVARRRTTS